MSVSLLLALVLAGGQAGAASRPEALPGDLPASGVSVPAEISALPLPAHEAAALKEALQRRDYRGAQAILLGRLDKVSQPDQRQPLLVSLGSMYFLARDPMQAAVAWQKAAQVGILPEQIQFSLAMAYVQMGRRDWAIEQLRALRAVAPRNALYPFWMGRMEYDEQRFSETAGYFRETVAIDPMFSRGHDNLGLCLYALNDVEGAIREEERAIELEKGKPGASAWPYLNLGIAEAFRGRSQPAMEAFQQALVLDPGFAQAHYHLGNLYDAAHREPEAIRELEMAMKADAAWAEPHASLARLYRRSGDAVRAKQQVEQYQGLKEKSSGVRKLP